MTKPNYKQLYKKYGGQPHQIRQRAMRNKARSMLGLKKGDKREVDHIIPLSKGGSNKLSNLRAVSFATNRSKGATISKK